MISNEQSKIGNFNFKPIKLETMHLFMVTIKDRNPFPKCFAQCASTLLELVHTNLCGLMQTNSIKGFSYFVTFIGDYSRFIAVYFLKQKFEVFKIFQNYKAYAENQIGHSIKALYLDNGREFTSKEFNNFYI